VDPLRDVVVNQAVFIAFRAVSAVAFTPELGRVARTARSEIDSNTEDSIEAADTVIALARHGVPCVAQVEALAGQVWPAAVR
jgi:hypothetical protein